MIWWCHYFLQIRSCVSYSWNIIIWTSFIWFTLWWNSFLLSYHSLQHNKYFYCSVFDDEQRCVEQELSCGVFVLLFFFLWVFFMFTYKILNSKLHHTKSHQTKETNFKTKQNIQTQRKEIKKTHTSWWVLIKSKDKP